MVLDAARVQQERRFRLAPDFGGLVDRALSDASLKSRISNLRFSAPQPPLRQRQHRAAASGKVSK
jgi:hypothetical protein